MENIPAPSFRGKKNEADFCGSIPLNFLNLIQPHGLLLVLQHDSFVIVQASENAAQLLGITAEELVAQPLERFLGQQQLNSFRQKLEHWEATHHLPLTLHWHHQATTTIFAATLHSKEAYLLLELEEVPENASSIGFTTIYQEISYVVGALKEAGSVEEIGRIATTELKKLSGFDRVMLYQFGEDWTGTVLAEAQEPDMPESYLGLRFPATDVPRQARELYRTTPYRIIANAEAPSAKLYPVINPLSGSLTDMAECVLRAVPKVHQEYLHNMGVKASMSTPVTIGNQLWGLISCHHRQPKQLSFEQRASFEILSGIVASQISSRRMEASFRYRSLLHQIELKLMEQLYTKPDLESGLFADPSYLMELLDVQGVALIIRHGYETAGQVPAERQVQNLVKWLSRYNKEKVFVTDSLPRLFNDATKYRELASGLIALQISGGKQYLLGFRPEVISQVHWGGNPNEAIKLEPDGKQYHPRNSFNLWKEQVEYTSAPWRPEVLEVAQHLRTAMLEKLVKEEESF